MNVNHLLNPTLSWLAVLLLMLAIFLFSAQPAGFCIIGYGYNDVLGNRYVTLL